MKFIAGAPVWEERGVWEDILKVFLRLRVSANRRVDLHPPLIASIETNHKSLVLKELTSNECGFVYAKQTQFRGVEDGSWDRSLCRMPARGQAPPAGYRTVRRLRGVGR